MVSPEQMEIIDPLFTQSTDEARAALGPKDGVVGEEGGDGVSIAQLVEFSFKYIKDHLPKGTDITDADIFAGMLLGRTKESFLLKQELADRSQPITSRTPDGARTEFQPVTPPFHGDIRVYYPDGQCFKGHVGAFGSGTFSKGVPEKHFMPVAFVGSTGSPRVVAFDPSVVVTAEDGEVLYSGRDQMGEDTFLPEAKKFLVQNPNWPPKELPKPKKFGALSAAPDHLGEHRAKQVRHPKAA